MNSFVWIPIIILTLWPFIIQCQNCIRDVDPRRVLPFFRWSQRNSVNYYEPDNIEHVCRNEDNSICTLPQDSRSQGFWGQTPFYIMYHPYMYGFQATKFPVANSKILKCGTIREDWNYSATNREMVPKTKMWEWADIGGVFYPADFYDLNVDSKGKCWGFPCPLAIKIYNRRFVDIRFNGYYIAYFPFRLDSLLGTGDGYTPSYKHSSRNIYLFPYDDEDPGKWVLSPVMDFSKCPGTHMKIQMNVIEPVSYEGLGTRFCFSMRTISNWQEILAINGSATPTVYEPGIPTVEPLPFQCGLTYRESENNLLGTGHQPFVVNLKIRYTRCIGTIISPLHILTLASCFLQDKDFFGIEETLIRRCGLESNWKRCPRWFRSNIGPDGRDAIEVQTMKTPLDHYGTNLRADWFEIHPLFNGAEFDVAIIGLKTLIQRTSMLHPICLPDWNRMDVEGKLTVDRLYSSIQWENFQMLYSLKALHKDTRFTNVWTDVNGPEKFVKCDIPAWNLSSNWQRHCDRVNPPPQLIGEESVYGDLYSNEPVKMITGSTGKNKYTCEYFYDVLQSEEDQPLLQSLERQVRNLQRNSMECFAMVTMEFEDTTQESIRCYERRPKCLRQRGWCKAGLEFGFCSEINELPDTPRDEHPLFEVVTFIYPKNSCSNGRILTSKSRICTGHITRSPTEYVFQVSKNDYSLADGSIVQRVIYEVVDYISGVQRPQVTAPDSTGRRRTLTTALEGTCHGAGEVTDRDNGAPTYFRYPIERTSSGQDQEPGNAYAVLYSLQRITGRDCDFKNYMDTEVLIAMDDVMQWIETVTMEPTKMKTFFDITTSKVLINLDRLTITTTRRTTDLIRTTTPFEGLWANKYGFLGSISETMQKYPGFRFFWGGSNKISTKPPIVYIEGYDLSDYENGVARKCQTKFFSFISIAAILRFL